MINNILWVMIGIILYLSISYCLENKKCQGCQDCCKKCLDWGNCAIKNGKVKNK